MKLKAEKSLFQIPQAEKYLSAILPRLEEKRARSFTTIVLSLFTLSFFGIFAISPTLSTIADLKKQISDNQFVDMQLLQKVNNLSKLQDQYKQIQPDLSYVYDAVPVNPDVTILVGQLQTVAQNSAVNLNHIQTLSVDVVNATSSYNAYTFAIDISGSYDSVSNFLKTLTNFNRLITVDAVSLTKSNTGSSYSLSLRGKAYFKSQ